MTAPAADGESGLRLLRDEHVQVVLTDLRMPRLDGLAVPWRVDLLDQRDARERALVNAHGVSAMLVLNQEGVRIVDE